MVLTKTYQSFFYIFVLEKTCPIFLSLLTQIALPLRNAALFSNIMLIEFAMKRLFLLQSGVFGMRLIGISKNF